MIGPTIALAAIFALICVMLRPGAALGVIIASMLLWPEYLRFHVGISQMSVPRIAALVLLVRLLSLGRWNRIRPGPADALVVVGWLWLIVAALANDSEEAHVTMIGGRVFDTVVMYFCARLAVLSRAEAAQMLPPLAITSVVMAAAGVLESVTSRSPYLDLYAYHQWIWFLKDNDYRLGFKRSQGSAAHPIMFGMSMLLVVGIAYSLRSVARHRYIAQLAAAAALLATLTSLSSGPMLGVALLIIFSAYYNVPTLIRPSVYLAALAALLLELLSNRHFFELIDYLALSSTTSWYRTRLLQVAFANLPEYWISGVGSNWPHHWGMQVDGRRHVDIVNNYVLVALYGGLPGLAIFLAPIVIGMKHVARAWRSTRARTTRSLVYGLGACLLALHVSAMSVSLFGPPLLCSFLLLGLCVDAHRRYVEAPAASFAVTPSPHPSRSDPLPAAGSFRAASRPVPSP